MKWALILILNLTFAQNTSAFTPDEANSLLEIHKQWHPKKIINSKDLCPFHNQLVKEAAPKYKHETLECIYRQEGSDTTAGDKHLQQQEAKILHTTVQVENIMNLRHPETTTMTPKQIGDSVVKQIMDDHGF